VNGTTATLRAVGVEPMRMGVELQILRAELAVVTIVVTNYWYYNGDVPPINKLDPWSPLYKKCIILCGILNVFPSIFFVQNYEIEFPFTAV
jgi:hypothetical protein